jgi:hypothetical protein
MGRTCELSSGGRRVAQFVPVSRALPARNVSFRGRFHLSVVGTNISGVPTTIDLSKIAVSGCNHLPISYSARSVGNFRANNPASPASKSCHVNNDRRIISGITSGNRFVRNRTGLYLHRGANIVAIFRPIPIVVQRTSIKVPIARPQIVSTSSIGFQAPVIRVTPQPAIRIASPPIIHVTPATPRVQIAAPVIRVTPKKTAIKRGNIVGVTTTTTSTSFGSSGGIISISGPTPIPVPKPLVFIGAKH